MVQDVVLNGTVLGDLPNLNIEHYAMTVDGVLNDREKYYMGERDVNRNKVTGSARSLVQNI